MKVQLDEPPHRETSVQAEPKSPLDRAKAMVSWIPGSRNSKYLAAVAGAAVLLVISLGLQDTPAYGPTGTLAEEVLVDRALRVQESPPTSLSSTSAEAEPVVALNPNALFVSAETGADDNPGTELDQPVRSLQLALDRVRPGQTVYVMDGTYTDLREPGNAHYVIRNGGTPEAWVTMEPLPGHQPVIVASDGNGLEIQADYVEVSGLRIRGEGYDPNSDPWGSAIKIRNSHHVRIVGNELSTMPTNGISGVESSNLAIIGNEIYENSYWSSVQGSGISLWHSATAGVAADPDGYHDRIIGNRIYRNENKVKSRWRNYEVITDGNGIIIDEGRDTGYQGRVLVANNVIFDNGGRAIMVFKSDNVDIIHNTTFRNGRTEGLHGGPAELVASQAGNVRIVNNLTWPQDGAPGIRIADADNIETAGNLVVSGGDPGAIGEADNVVSGNPGLANPQIDETQADFRPLSSSQAVRSPVEVGPHLGFDFDGLPREPGSDGVGAHIPSEG